MFRRFPFSFGVLFVVALLVLGRQLRTEAFEITHNLHVPATVEVVDQQNPQAKRRFDLTRGQSKSLSITGTSVRVTVYEKGTGQRKTGGSFPSRAAVQIESRGTQWVLRQSR